MVEYLTCKLVSQQLKQVICLTCEFWVHIIRNWNSIFLLVLILLALLGFHFHIHILEIINILFENTITKKFIFYLINMCIESNTKKEENCWHFGKLRNLTNKLRNLTKKHDHEKIINSLGSRIKYFIYCKHNIAVCHQLWKKKQKSEMKDHVEVDGFIAAKFMNLL